VIEDGPPVRRAVPLSEVCHTGRVVVAATRYPRYPGTTSMGVRTMDVASFNINITSDQADVLHAFYRDVVGLPLNEQVGGFMVGGGGAMLLIDGHSDTKGRAKEPQRVLINFMVDDIAKEQAALEAKGVKFLRNQGREEWGGIISTFQDPDGNYLQLIEYKP